MQVDVARKEVTLKVVYYGPALSGKTTNLQAIHRVLNPDSLGRLMTLETRDDRTLFFDLLPIRVDAGGGLKLKLKVFTVPGQVFHNATRRLVLQGADGVAFVADSRVSEIASNAEAFQNMVENLKENGLSPESTPLVIQFNKRDLPGVRPDREIDALACRGREPVYKSIATEGKGVVETFLGLLHLTWTTLDARHGLGERFGVDTRRMFVRLVSQLGLPKTLDLGAAVAGDRTAGGGAR